MPKGRGTISISSSKEETGNSGLQVNYCICGEFILVVDAPLLSLPRRPLDNSITLLNSPSPDKRVYKLNVSDSNPSLIKPKTLGGDGGGGGGAAGKEGNGVLVLRNDGKFEFQRRFYCPRCQLQIGYETVPSSNHSSTTPNSEQPKGVATFILPGALTDTQNKVPANAFGEPSITPAGPPKGLDTEGS